MLSQATTIHFDRSKVRKMCRELSRKADEMSAQLDAALINTSVDYLPPFDVNETFAEVFASFAGADTAE